MSQETAGLLAAMPVFEQLSPEQLDWLAGQGEVRELPAGVELVKEDGLPTGFWFLLDGEIELRRQLGGVEVRMGSSDRMGSWVGAVPYVYETSLITGILVRPSRLLWFSD